MNVDEFAIFEVSNSLQSEVEQFLAMLRGRYINGSAIGLQCRISDTSGVDLCSPVVVERVTKLLADSTVNSDFFGEPRDTIELEEVNPLVLDGKFACQIVDGGAYSNSFYDQAEAKRIGSAAAESLLQGRYTDFLIVRSRSCWSSWFHGVAWDTSWFILDKQEHRLTMLCSTDTD